MFDMLEFATKYPRLCFGWDTAWDISCQTFSYTNTTLLPEALERWPLPLFKGLLPRHLEIIFEINRRFLDEMRKKFPNDDEKMRRMSLVKKKSAPSAWLTWRSSEAKL